MPTLKVVHMTKPFHLSIREEKQDLASQIEIHLAALFCFGDRCFKITMKPRIDSKFTVILLPQPPMC